jgi:hypothetical protein
MKSISFLKDAARSVVFAGVMLGAAGVVSAQVGGATGGGMGSIGSAGVAGSAGDAGSVGIPGAANAGTIGIPGGAGDAGRAGIPGQAGDAGSVGGVGGMVSPGVRASDSMTGQGGALGERSRSAPGRAVTRRAPPNPAEFSTSESARQRYGSTGVELGGRPATPGTSAGGGE